MPICRGALLLMAAGLLSSACSHTQPPAYGPPLPSRPTHLELLREFAKLRPKVQGCWGEGRGAKPLLQLHVNWPETAPVVFSATSNPENPAFDACVQRAARAEWVRAFGGEALAPSATEFSVYFRVE